MCGHDLAVCRGEGGFPLTVCARAPHLGGNKFTSTLPSSGHKNGELFFYFLVNMYLLTKGKLAFSTLKGKLIYFIKRLLTMRRLEGLEEEVVQRINSAVKITFPIATKELLGEDMLLPCKSQE